VKEASLHDETSFERHSWTACLSGRRWHDAPIGGEAVRGRGLDSDQWRRTGDVGPRRQGGDHRSHHLEAHAAEILGMVGDTPDITLSELAEHLDEAHGVKAAQSTIWRLLDRHGMTFKKNRARQRAAAG
jgi:hypothetical protein